MKNTHEIRDPIHVFIRLDSDERRVLDSRPFQRLRHIHQLAMTYLIYPGATHKRFEHSLGVMELAGRVFDIVTNPDHVTDDIKDLLGPLNAPDQRAYWRRVVRMAALCHDIGHLPFSHAAEKELLPDDWDHEDLTRKIIVSDEMKTIWGSGTPPLRPEDLEKLAIGPKKATDLEFADWETILTEIIVGDAFGVDRMDYLLRDSHHVGVVYGKFDHHLLIDTLRILPPRRNPKDVTINPESGKLVFEALADQYGEEHFRHDRYSQKSGAPDFPVRMRDGRIVSSITFSEVLSNIPVVSIDYVFANRQFFAEANTWLNDNRLTIINKQEEEKQDG